MNEPRRVLHLVTCAAPPCRHITELIELLLEDEWSVHVIATAAAMSWLPLPQIEHQTGRPVLHQPRRPDEPKRLPPADAIAVVPATFNTINAWASGINDTPALGVLNAALSSGKPIVASVYAKPELTSHPAFASNVRLLRDARVQFTETNALRQRRPDDVFQWKTVIDLLRIAAPAPS